MTWNKPNNVEEDRISVLPQISNDANTKQKKEEENLVKNLKFCSNSVVLLWLKGNILATQLI